MNYGQRNRSSLVPQPIHYSAACALLTLLWPGLVLAAPQPQKGPRSGLPNTKAGQVATAFFKAFNSGDEAQVRAFEESYRAKSALKERSVEDRLATYRQLRKKWGDLEVDGIFESKPLRISMGVNSLDSGEFLRVEFELEEEEPHGLLAVYMQGGLPRPTRVQRVVAKPLSDHLRRDTVERIATILDASYVYPEVGKKMAEMLRANLKYGKYNDLTETASLAQTLTSDLRVICHDKHLGVTGGHFPEGEKIDNDGDDAWWAKSKRENYGFEKVERLPGNIGYVKLNQFHPSTEAQEIAAAAMNFVANCDAVIFDLRENGGGSPEMIAYLAGYLFDDKVHLNSFYDRKEDKQTETWSRTDVAGRKFGAKKPVYVLTSAYTFSGAEEFTYDLKCLKRATVVGETTGGGAHPVERERVNDDFAINVPYARAINPITKTNWEGVGVSPDIDVPADRALPVAEKDAIEHLLASTSDDEQRQALSVALRRVQRDLEENNVATNRVVRPGE